MSKKKLQRFAETATFPNFFQPALKTLQEGFTLRGNWNRDFFGNQNPIVLELGCGKAEYTTRLARERPDRNFIGIDIKGARMWRGARTSVDEELRNVAFVRTYVSMLNHFFGPEEVYEIWIPFPDPHPRRSDMLKRLTSPRFLEIYQKFLHREAVIHLKTDDDGLFQYTLDVIERENHLLLNCTRNIYVGPADEPAAAGIQTFYEMNWLKEGKTIKYLRFSLHHHEE